jgi:hypothetical protein
MIHLNIRVSHFHPEDLTMSASPRKGVEKGFEVVRKSIFGNNG